MVHELVGSFKVYEQVRCCVAGIPWAEHQWDGTWSAIKKVWASKWNDRAVLSLRRAGLSHALLQMAVLCQQVVPAQYAFVAHTTHPTTGQHCNTSLAPCCHNAGAWTYTEDKHYVQSQEIHHCCP